MGDQHDEPNNSLHQTKQPYIRFFVSGFGRFHGVDTNPTSEILQSLKAEVEGSERGTQCFPDQVRVEVCEIMETSAVGCTSSLDQCFVAKDQADWTSVYLHLGVCTSTFFRLEEIAVNCANFRCPDEKGYQPQHLPIDMSTPDVTCQRRCKLPLNELAAQLEAKGWRGKVQTSEDAGRFVCNYTYYQSLMRTDEYPNKMSIFIHVPHFEHIGEQSQLQFVKDTICIIAEQLQKTPNLGPSNTDKGSMSAGSSCILI